MSKELILIVELQNNAVGKRYPGFLARTYNES
jgi:hypothetical protein